jgi:hypothetical protein
MKKLTLSLTLLLPILLVGLTTSSNSPVVQQDDAHVRMADPEYIGATRCRTCHRTEKSGGQYGIWEESAHAKAYATLASEKALAIGKEKGIDNPQESPECLQCHVAGYNAPAEQLGSKYDMTEGVTCESCHGPGGDYYKKATMEGITKGEIDPASVGLKVPDEATCRTCHNEKSPTFEGFDFEARSAEIAHPIPEETKAAL